MGTQDLEKTAHRVGVFVDIQNIYYSAKSLYNSKLNYSRILPFIANGRTIVVANAYILSKAEIKISDFNNMLYENGFDIQKKLMEFKTRKNHITGVESQHNTVNWEIGIVIDMLKWAPKLDTIALVSGNGNYIDAIRHLKHECRVEIYSFDNSTAGVLKREANDFFALDDTDEEGEENLLIPIEDKEEKGTEKGGSVSTTDEEEREEVEENVGNKK